MTQVLQACLTGCFLFILNSATLPANGQAQWTLKTNDDGIQLYTKSVPGSPYKDLKTVCTLRTTLSSVAAVLLDVAHSKDWVYGTASSRLLKQESPSVSYFYAEMEMPWPVTNRDFIVKISLTQDPVSKVITVLAENQPDYLPETKKPVRIRNTSGKWRIDPLPNGLVRVEYQLYVDPGGSVPPALVNLFSGKGPIESFRNLRQLVTRKPYAHAVLPFVQD